MTYFYKVVHMGQKNMIIPPGGSECHKHPNSPAFVCALSLLPVPLHFLGPHVLQAREGNVVKWIFYGASHLYVQWIGVVQRIHLFKCPSVTLEGRRVPEFARSKVWRYPKSVPLWGSEPHREFLDNHRLPGPTKGLVNSVLQALECGPRENISDTRGHCCLL